MKVKCTICGKVGSMSFSKGLKRHMKLAHNISTAKGYFVPADPDAVVEILHKKYRNEANRVNNIKRKKLFNKKLREKFGAIKRKSINWGSIIKTAYETKR